MFVVLIGQIVGGLLATGSEEEAVMVGFTSLALANAVGIPPIHENTSVMTLYLIIQAFVMACLIGIISLSMRLLSKVGGTQFTAYMSLFNLSGVFAYTLTERMISVFDYTSAIYIGAALTLIRASAVHDEDETDRHSRKAS